MTTEQRRHVVRGARGGIARSAVGAFMLSLCVELSLIPEAWTSKPNVMIALTFAFGQFFYGALSRQQWRALLGDR